MKKNTIVLLFTTFSIFLEQKLHLPVFLQPQLALYLHTKANLYDPFILSSSDYTINLLSFFILYTCTQKPIYTILLFSFPQIMPSTFYLGWCMYIQKYLNVYALNIIVLSSNILKLGDKKNRYLCQHHPHHHWNLASCGEWHTR